MDLFTIQMGKRFEATKRKIRVIDTTVKTSDRLFSPTWNMVLGHKEKVAAHERGEILEQANQTYAQEYRRMMIDSWVRNRARWMEVINSEEPVAFACYCPKDKFCHRLLLRDMIEQICKKLNLPYQYYGEL
jgi:hypothetical protein